MSQTDIDITPTSPCGSQYFLVGDIGGTNARLELINACGEVVKKLVAKTADFHSFAELLTHFMEGIKGNPEHIYGSVCFASKILHNKTVTNANYKWDPTDGEYIKNHFGLKEMILLNDFEACGYSVPILDKSHLMPLTGNQMPNLSGNFKVMLVGPGTGLGVCLLSQK